MSDQTSSERNEAIRPSADEAVLARRGLIRAGAIAAAAAAGAVAATATSATQAEAATGDPIKIGQAFTASNAATTLAVTGSTTVPALKLTNLTGPALTLTPVTGDDLDATLPVGAIASTSAGPLIGLADESGAAFTSTLATGADLAALPVASAITPVRLLDTRNASARTGILASSSGAFDSSGRLKIGAYLDLAVGDATADVTLEAAFLNATVTGAVGGGHVTLCPPGPKPSTSSVNFTKGQTVANATFVLLGVIEDYFAVRIYTSQTTHVIIDLTGATVTGIPGPAAASANSSAKAGANGADRARRSRPAARFTRSLGHVRRRG